MQKKRRSNGDGGIRYRQDREIWEVQVTIGTDPLTGRQIRVSRTAKSEAEAIRLKNQLISGHVTGTLVENNKITIGELVDLCYDTIYAPSQYETTRRLYQSIIRIHIKPLIGHYQVQQTTYLQLQQYFNRLQEPGSVKHCNFTGELTNHSKGLSLSVTKRIRGLIIAAYDLAAESKIVAGNIARKIKLSKKEKPKTVYFRKDEIIAFLAATHNRRYHLAYRLLFETGMRRSELLGLTWPAVDFSNAKIYVSKALTSFGDFVELRDSTKTEAGTRTIPIHPDTLALLALHKENQEIEAQKHPKWSNGQSMVFVQSDGTPVKPTEFTKGFKDAVKSAGLRPELGVHAARRSFATMLLAAGISVADVMHLGGWSDPEVILECYAKSQENECDRAAGVMRSILEDKSNKKAAPFPDGAASPKIPAAMSPTPIAGISRQK